jgi:hypothetical protein
MEREMQAHKFKSFQTIDRYHMDPSTSRHGMSKTQTSHRKKRAKKGCSVHQSDNLRLKKEG